MDLKKKFSEELYKHKLFWNSQSIEKVKSSLKTWKFKKFDSWITFIYLHKKALETYILWVLYIARNQRNFILLSRFCECYSLALLAVIIGVIIFLLSKYKAIWVKEEKDWGRAQEMWKAIFLIMTTEHVSTRSPDILAMLAIAWWYFYPLFVYWSCMFLQLWAAVHLYDCVKV